jgi:uncharacterized protein (DUF1800 family)
MIQPTAEAVLDFETTGDDAEGVSMKHAAEAAPAKENNNTVRALSPLLPALGAAALAACGGGGEGAAVVGGGSGGSPPTSPPAAPPPPPPPPSGLRPTVEEASRFLIQASFGPTDAAIAEVQDKGYAGWIDAQLAAPMFGETHLAWFDFKNQNPLGVAPTVFYESWWKQAVTANDQLRQRMTFALSQIFVLSLQDGNIFLRGAIAYYDMLAGNALGNYRKLLEDVTLNPQMGRYLTYLANSKEEGVRQPDENFAREIMQLMSIGLFELNPDGTKKLDGAGKTIPTYDSDDVRGLARVFTGLSWWHTTPSEQSFNSVNLPFDAQIKPMIFYPAHHSTSEKKFLSATIPASATADVGGDLKIALDTLFNHPNVGPFMATRLIQQFVTSNPSPAYVGRVAAVFANNGAGVRGDFGATIKAVLLDAEARDVSLATQPGFGKLREPVVRISNWARAFKAVSASGGWGMGNTTATIALSQSPLSSPSVFNFWRPGYTPPATTEAGSRGLVAPEFQVVDEVSTATWVNLMYETVALGFGSNPRDVTSAYASELALANDTPALLARLNQLLFAGQMSDVLKGKLTAAVNNVPYPGTNEPTARRNRAWTAIFLSLISPEFMVQR